MEPDLVIFRAVAREGGIVRAARSSTASRPAATTRIKQLEASIGVPLFTAERQRPRAVAGGDSGSSSTPSRMLQSLRTKARTAVADAAPSGDAAVRGAPESHHREPPARRSLAAYHAAHPAMSVGARHRHQRRPHGRGARAQRVHAAFVAEAPADPRLASLPLFRERL